MSKLYRVGICSGRFQHIHKIHEFLIKNSLTLCDRTVLFISHPDICRTLTDPFTYDERYTLICKIFADYISKGELIVLPLHKNYNHISEWCANTCRYVEELIGERPGVVFQGSDKREPFWFKPGDTETLTEVTISENIYIDGKLITARASEIRDLLYNEQYDEWAMKTNPLIHEYYKEMVKIVKEVRNNA